MNFLYKASFLAQLTNTHEFFWRKRANREIVNNILIKHLEPAILELLFYKEQEIEKSQQRSLEAMHKARKKTRKKRKKKN